MKTSSIRVPARAFGQGDGRPSPSHPFILTLALLGLMPAGRRSRETDHHVQLHLEASWNGRHQLQEL